MWPILAVITCLFANAYLLPYHCPEMLHDNSDGVQWFGTKNMSECAIDLFMKIHIQFYTRMSSYFLGAISALWYEQPRKAPDRSKELEFLCTIVILAISYLGANGPIIDGEQVLRGYWFWFYMSTIRIIFGLCWCYMIPGILTNTEITSDTPAYYFHALLSSKIWLPISTISYTIYIWHTLIISYFFSGESNSVKSVQDLIVSYFYPDSSEFNCGENGIYGTLTNYIFFLGNVFVVSWILAAISFILIKRPF